MTIHAMTALELRKALDENQLTSEQVVSALIARRRAVEPALHAFVLERDREALDEARRADAERRADPRGHGPLHGLPITVKENVQLRGTASTLGVAKRRAAIADEDAVTVRLAREQGAIVLGKTNVPQTLIAMETTNFLFGTTNNPFGLGRTPGGSSGGEAAAIAAGASVLGIGTDIGGSVRIPAAYTGLATIKPSLHRWSNRGSIGLLLGQEIVRSQIGPMARTSDDVAFFLRALDTPLHASSDPEVPPFPIGDPSAVSLAGMRIGYYEDDGYFTPCATSKRAVRQAVDALRAAGAELVPCRPTRADEHYTMMACAVTADGLATLDGWLGDDPVIAPVALNRRLGGTPKRARALLAKALSLLGEARLARTMAAVGERSVQDYWKLGWERTVMQRTELDAWNAARIDAVVCPATATAAPPHGATADFTATAVYTTRYNLLNLPAGVAPCTTVRADETARSERADRLDQRAAEIQQRSTGLPVGVQVVGRPYREDVVLALMQCIERDARARGEAPRTPIDPRP